MPASQSAFAMQDPWQAVAFALHERGAHATVTSVGHEPAPSQLAAWVAVPVEQLAARQLVSPAGNAQPAGETPSHEPPQAVPSVAQAVRPLRGAPATAMQLPSCPASPHDSH